MQVARRQFALTLGCWLAMASELGLAAERYQIAREADLVVTGKLSGARWWPWFGGWRLTGELVVNETLWGQPPNARNLPYRFVCSCCPFWPRQDPRQFEGILGLWFLKVEAGDLRSAGDCADPGYRPREDLNDMRAFLGRRKKATPSPR